MKKLSLGCKIMKLNRATTIILLIVSAPFLVLFYKAYMQTAGVVMEVSGFIKSAEGKPLPGVKVKVSCIVPRFLNSDMVDERMHQTNADGQGWYRITCQEANSIDVSIEIPKSTNDNPN